MILRKKVILMVVSCESNRGLQLFCPSTRTELVRQDFKFRNCTGVEKIMGDFLGHAVPGAMLLLLSIWWFMGPLLQARKNSKTLSSRRGLLRSPGSSYVQLKSESPVWYPCPGRCLSRIPVEPIIKVLSGIVGVVGELFLDGSWILIDEKGEFVDEHINNHSHTVMYCFFSLSGIIDLVLWHGKTPLPPRIDYIILSTCFWIEGFLFYFHLQGHSEISMRLHIILYILIFITASVVLVESFLRQHQLLFSLIRAILTGVQGSWFFQIAFVLYGPNAWKDSPRNVEFLSIAFGWHLFIYVCVALVLFVACHLCCGKIHPHYDDRQEQLRDVLLSDEEEESFPLESQRQYNNSQAESQCTCLFA